MDRLQRENSHGYNTLLAVVVTQLIRIKLSCLLWLTNSQEDKTRELIKDLQLTWKDSFFIPARTHVVSEPDYNRRLEKRLIKENLMQGENTDDFLILDFVASCLLKLAL